MPDIPVETTSLQPIEASPNTPDMFTKPTITFEDAFKIFEGTERFKPLPQFATQEDSRQFMLQVISTLAKQQPISHETQAAQLKGEEAIQNVVESAKNKGEVEQLAHIFMGERILQEKLINSGNNTSEEQQARLYQLGRMAGALEVSYRNRMLKLMAENPKNPKLIEENNRARLFYAASSSLFGFD